MQVFWVLEELGWGKGQIIARVEAHSDASMAVDSQESLLVQESPLHKEFLHKA